METAVTQQREKSRGGNWRDEEDNEEESMQDKSLITLNKISTVSTVKVLC